MKWKSCCNCRRLVTHCSAAIIHSMGFITKLLLVNTLIIQCRSHARIVTQLFAMRMHATWTTMSTKGIEQFRISLLFAKDVHYMSVHRTKLSTTLRSTLTHKRKRKGTNTISETICSSAKIDRTNCDEVSSSRIAPL